MRTGPLGSDESAGNNGAFIFPMGELEMVRFIASDGYGWEHVSISLCTRCPTWEEMCYFKDLFWDDDDFVVQMHPPKSVYVNNHPYCLHLWRKAGTNDFCERPPSVLVGIRGLEIE